MGTKIGFTKSVEHYPEHTCSKNNFMSFLLPSSEWASLYPLGFCVALGTLTAPIIEGGNLLNTQGGIIIIIGIFVCVARTCVVGYAGVLRSQTLFEEDKKNAIKKFALKKGLL